MENLNEFIALILLAVIGIVYQCFKRYSLSSGTKLIEKWFKEKFSGEDITKEFSEIQERMVEIKTILDADRVVIDQFHNGTTFTNNKPLWKITRTYEICSNGVSYESLKIQNIMAVLLWDSVSAIFEPKNKPYFEQIKGDKCKQSCKIQYGVYRYNVDLMPESMGKVLLRNQGIRSFLQIPLVLNQNIVGYVAVHYLDEEFDIEDVCQVCQRVQEIAYFLNKE